MFIIPAFLICGATVGYLFSTGASVSASSILGPGNSAVSNAKVTLQVNVNHNDQHSVDLLWLIQMAFKGQFWRPSCLLFCSNGVSYYLDPTVLITNYGRDFEQCKVFGASGTITCTAADVATVIGVSTGSTVPAATDTWGGTGPCTALGGLQSTNGFVTIAGTVTPGTAGTNVATSVSNKFTDNTAPTSNLQAACLFTELTATGTNIILYAEGTFGPDNLVVGNAITITWSVTRA
jgi:hypothetical protein